MKNIAKITTITIIAIAFGSCNKKDVKTKDKSQSPVNILEKALQLKISAEAEADIYLIANSIQTIYNKGNEASFSFQGTLDYRFCEKIKINNYSIPINPYDNSLYASSDEEKYNLTNINDFFGKSNSITLCKNVINDFYLPRTARILNSKDFIFSKKEGINLDIDFDPNNSNPNVVAIQYQPETAQVGDIILTKRFILQPGENFISIPPSELTDFPIGEKLIIYIGSGNYTEFSYNNKTYGIQGLVLTTVPRVKLR